MNVIQEIVSKTKRITLKDAAISIISSYQKVTKGGYLKQFHINNLWYLIGLFRLWAMKEAVRDLLGAIGRVINFLFPFCLPERIYRHMGFKGAFVFKIEKNKLRFINVREVIANDIFYSGIFGNFEGETLRLWWEISKEVNGLVLDIGAHSGIYSLVAATANKQSSIVAFEPHPE